MRRWLALVAVMGMVTACISVSEHKLATLDPGPRPTPPRKIRVFSSWTIQSASLSEVQKEAIADRYSTHFARAMKRNGCCEEVESQEEADLILRASSPMETRYAALIAALLTGATLYIIPSWATEEVNITATVEASGRSYAHAWRDSTTLIQWLPLLLAMPFFDWPETGTAKLVQRVFDHVVVDIVNDYQGERPSPATSPKA